MPREVEVQTVVQATSAGESVYTDGREVWLSFPDPDRASAFADADELLDVAEGVERLSRMDGKADISVRVGGIEVRDRDDGTNPIYLADAESAYKQNTNAEAVRDAVEMARER